jgi:hypothetical protein
MGTVREPDPAMLFVGVLHHISVDRDRIFSILEREFGAPALISSIFEFTETAYYFDEMGSRLFRFWAGFRKLLDPGRFAEVKLRTNELESRFSVNGRRRVNLDPGYLTLGKVVLASTKDNQHRVYLEKGIFAEVTLRYRKDSFEPWEWTYRDYRRQEAGRFFHDLRMEYRELLRNQH